MAPARNIGFMPFANPITRFHRQGAVLPRDVGKWCACALALLVPGSFIFLPVLWLVRHTIK